MAYFKIHGTSGGRSETGVRTIIQPYWVDTIEAIDSLEKAEISLGGLPLVDWAFGVYDQELKENGYQVGLRYEGIPSGAPLNERPVWQLSGELVEWPIERHPNVQTLIDDYGGYIENGRLKFPPTRPKGKGDDSGGGGFAQGSDETGEEANIMWNAEKIRVYLPAYHWSFVSRRKPSLLDKVGKVIKRPPGNPETPEGSDWLYAVPDIAYRGNIYEVTEHYMGSPPGGWPPEVAKLVVKGTKSL